MSKKMKLCCLPLIEFADFEKLLNIVNFFKNR